MLLCLIYLRAYLLNNAKCYSGLQASFPMMYVHSSLSLITNNKIDFYVISTRMLINFELLEPKLNFLHVPLLLE
jgi:hypothetical protein